MIALILARCCIQRPALLETRFHSFGITARSVHDSALRSSDRRWLAVIIVTDRSRSADARSRHAAPVSLVNPRFAAALGVETSKEFASLFMEMHLLASGSTSTLSH